MNNTQEFKITDHQHNESVFELVGEENQRKDGYYQLMLIETPKEQKPDFDRQFLRITHSNGTLEFCMAVGGQVPFGENNETVYGFPQSVQIYIPDFLLPIIKQAINKIK